MSEMTMAFIIKSIESKRDLLSEKTKNRNEKTDKEATNKFYCFSTRMGTQFT